MNTILKRIAFILVLCCCSASWSQQFVLVDSLDEKDKGTKKENTISDEEYNAFLNQVPKSFAANTKTRPQNRVLEGNLNSIGSLELRYAYQKQLNLNAAEIKWLEEEINGLAVAFFAEGKQILLRKAGNPQECVDRGIITDERNGYIVKIFKFCYTCPGADAVEDRFVAVLNNRMEKLMTAKK